MKLISVLIVAIGGVYASYVVGYERGAKDVACRVMWKFRAEGRVSAKDVQDICAGDFR